MASTSVVPSQLRYLAPTPQEDGLSAASLAELLPLFGWFGIGLLLKTTGFAGLEHARFLLKLVFFVTLPALVLLIIARTPITAGKAALPLANIAINLCCMALTLLAARIHAVERRTLGSMLVSTMIINNAFMFPFILAGLGEAAFADAVLFDFGNAVMTATFTYALAFRYGDHRATARDMLQKIVQSPLVWAIAIALCLNLGGAALPGLATGMLDPLGRMTAPLLLMSLGLYFSPRMANLGLVSTVVLIRMGFGLAAGIGLAHLFGLEGTARVVTVLCAAAPVGFNALTFAALAKLDTDLAASAVSLSAALGLVYIPVLMLLLT